MKRHERLETIKKVISEHQVGTQAELIKILQTLNINITQSTLSRDLSTLKASLLPHPKKKHIYAISDSFLTEPHRDAEAPFPVKAFKGIAFSGNLAVIKCWPSFAPNIAMVMDSTQMDEIVGTVAGDDTVLVVLKESTGQLQFRLALQKQFPELNSVL